MVAMATAAMFMPRAWLMKGSSVFSVIHFLRAGGDCDEWPAPKSRWAISSKRSSPGWSWWWSGSSFTKSNATSASCGDWMNDQGRKPGTEPE